MSEDARRRLPSVDQALQQPDLQELAQRRGRPAVLRALRETLAELRRLAAATDAPDDATLERRLAALAVAVAERVSSEAAPSLVRVLNATGVVVHTNLGRAPLSRAAAQRVAEVASSYCNLEYDLPAGCRGHREVHAEERLRALLGAEAAVVVNNCAAAVLLTVNGLAEGREVIVSRGELVEIGGSFRIPDVLRKGGARLREVGTTNRTRLADYRNAIGPETALLLKVHPSNFRVSGFTEEAGLPELAALAAETGLPLVEDQGSGAVATLPGPLAGELTVRRSLEDGAHLVAFSGDKLLGGPQAGLIVGRTALVDRLRRNPLYRALRVDKMTLAALDATLVEYRSERAREAVPVLRMLHESPESLAVRSAAFKDALAAAAPGVRLELLPGESAAGGGSAPLVGLATTLVAVLPAAGGADALATRLRTASPPVVARVAEDRLLLDLRTVASDEEPALIAALAAALND